MQTRAQVREAWRRKVQDAVTGRRLRRQEEGCARDGAHWPAVLSMVECL
jgi:hypothetical protein